MEELLDNPVFSALCSGDQHLAFGNTAAKYFDENVSPFAGFSHDSANGFQELYQMLPAGRVILYASPLAISAPEGWQLLHEIEGLQFVWNRTSKTNEPSLVPIPLTEHHVSQMTELAALTKPGPFAKRTIEFGHYHGFFYEAELIAMTGQRLHIGNYTEISAVCTHPSHLGKGYAQALVQHQVNLITAHNQVPFLHVRKDNLRAIALYERLGFEARIPMNFYVLRRQMESESGQ